MSTLLSMLGFTVAITAFLDGQIALGIIGFVVSIWVWANE